DKGIESRELIPGKLKLKRRASIFYKRYLATKDYTSRDYAYALAASEENASGGTIVTAPTCGAAGVIPGVFFSL
ncbi:serine dehydratase, partial [Veillonellaceae bacterium M2-8]|nr:serine dehydratase [Veillonellaceae bacterium M2-8]